MAVIWENIVVKIGESYGFVTNERTIIAEVGNID